MGRISRWLRDNFDGVITIIVVVATLVPRLLNVPALEPPIDQSLLVIMGLLAVTIMRHQGGVEQEGEPRGVRNLNRDEIRHEHEQARRHTTIWMFKGGTGTYLRAVTLPQCVANADRVQSHLDVQAEIVDPTNQGLCVFYSDLRRARPDHTGEPWTPERTRIEAYATILAACWYRQRYRTILDIEVALSATVPTFRWDISSTCVLMTQEDHAPHLMFKEPSPHYNFCTRELNASFKQARRVQLELASNVLLSDEPTVGEARRLFDALEIALPDSVADDDVAQVVAKALHARNPYP